MKEWGSVPSLTPVTTMPDLSLSGLASGLDWKSLVDSLMEIEAAPITRLEREQTTNTQKANALGNLETKLTAFQAAAKKIKDQALFTGRSVSSSTTSSTWKLSATAGTAAGAHTIAVSQLATKARRDGAVNITGGLAATADVAGVTLATMRTASVVTSGNFTINGAKVTVATTDSLQDIFDRIATATDNDVTATYDPVADKITLESASDAKIVLGAANDTSNFLAVLKLANNDTDTVTSYGTLGSARTGNALVSSGLTTAITAVDGDGAGTFSINGVAINYNVNTDSLNTILKRINSSGAGVSATYDAVNDRVQLDNSKTGDLGMTLSETSGGLLGALGLTTGFTSTRGKNAEFSIDGGPMLISSSNTLDSAMLGVTGLAVTVDSATTQTLTVTADTAKMKDNIKDFIDAYNAVQTFIDTTTKVTTVSGKVTPSVLTSNRDVQDWATQLRRMAFAQVGGAGTIDRLDDLGIDLAESGQMSIKNADKLTAALADHGSDVEAFFTTATTGFAAKFDDRLTKFIKFGDDSQDRLVKTNSNIDRQIADLQRRLEQQRSLLTSSFIAMESAQSRIQQQSSAMTNAFGSTSNSK
jgi:flagellar hook-associated protein 2